MSASPPIPPPAAIGAPAAPRTLKARACDQCHARRIKCSGEGVPCLSCARAELSCTFNKQPRKKGPKGTVLESLRKAATDGPVQAGVVAPAPAPPAQQSMPEGTRATAADCFSLNTYLGLSISPQSMVETPQNSLSSFFMGLPSSAQISNHPPNLPAPPPSRNPSLAWLSIVTKTVLLPQIDTFYSRLHPILPILPRHYIQSGIDAHIHLQDPSFAALLLAMSAMALVGPVAANEREDDRQELALSIIEETMRVKGMVTHHSPTMEGIWTNFMLFGALFNTGQHDAAWCRLRESLTLAETLELHKQTTYDSLPIDECSRRIRTLWVLMVTERAYAMQRNHSIIFTASTGIGWALGDLPWLQADVTDPKDLSAMLGLRCLAHLYYFIDEDIISCWNGKCLEGVCETLDAPQVVALQRGLGAWAQGFTEESMAQLSEANRADLLISQQWLRNRIWQLTVSHCLSGDNASEPELRPAFSLKIAEDTIKVCKMFSPAALEANGVGVAHKLHDIILSIIYSNRILDDHSHSEPWMTSPPLVLGHHLRAELTTLLRNFRGGRHPFLKPVLEML
ncbi:hypothetical protein BCR35DRAFT_309128 [Leucosporidium creatinivorum]|uniref:Zn(2)-C6 fungal-type domain-containing protein n=1 Tax=Leucosporidium creatinivorum TaxID=106004 RepID=A0A1Y2DQX4_9BASI|nr:hypothetical protein BCR35DRAFT_309128 [Leucosporidium creatinivorum]